MSHRFALVPAPLPESPRHILLALPPRRLEEHDVRRRDFDEEAEVLKTVWARLGAQERLPRIDFKTELVLVGVVRSGLVTFMQPVLDDKGDLKRNLVATPDAPSFRSYAVAVIAREGIRSIDGERVK